MTARRFALEATGLVCPHSNADEVLNHLGFIQIDPINVCGRMHEHICRNRISNHQEGDLHQYLYGIHESCSHETPVLPAESRTAFEHFHPGRWVLAAFPLEAWPYLQGLMKQRSKSPGQWGGKLTPDERKIAKYILNEIENRGALGSEHIVHEGRSHNGWNNSRTVKVVLDKLFAHGKLLISRRLNGRRIYDLPSRVLPEEILNSKTPTPSQIKQWTAHLKLRQHRLTPLTRNELPLVKNRILPVEVDGCAPLYILKSDAPQLESLMSNNPPPSEDLKLLAPLDPLILNRTLTRQLWDFDYTWEVYTPPAKRTRGYYALPILAGIDLIGDVDLKADRKKGKLLIQSKRVAKGYKVTPAVKELAAFLSLKR